MIAKQLFGVVIIHNNERHETEVEARDFEDAAEQAIDEDDCYDSDYPVAGKGESRTVEVTDINGHKKRFTVTGEFIATYSAEEIEDETQQPNEAE